MFSLKSLVLALATLSLSTSSYAAPATGLRRRTCKAKPSKVTGAANFAPAPTANTNTTVSKPKPAGCFPSAGFQTPDSPTKFDLDDWWCSSDSEYAFLGFSYGVNGCPSKSSMTSSFKQMRSDFGARYIRMYATCDRSGFFDDVVEAAYDAGLGVYALVWLGFDGDDSYKGRLNSLLNTVKTNKLAPYVIRSIAIGSEAMFDNAISASALASTIKSVKGQVKKYGITVSTSDMAYQYTQNKNVLNAVDNVQLNVLPFFSGAATTGARANVMSDINSVKSAGKKVILTQTGWPSNQSVWKANAASAVASVNSEKAYFDYLDDQCSTFKKSGSAWFAHIWDDNQLGGWGIVNNGKAKFDFNARSKC
ncbi:glycoside hydrolase [Exidia glandulosa HHB12029]|uniref:glucan endo-1,3-beta-D-glucosidase n=1 Tax=Exidia glandulosa HHB12029 TaxID=1314781 RepID=A0A165CYC9_EXIGL|nr:glycoside hydrolase [Exidia glandulosa HHB12029]